jgi:hypothetical protein
MELVKDFIPASGTGRRKRTVDIRDVLFDSAYFLLMFTSFSPSFRAKSLCYPTEALER